MTCLFLLQVVIKCAVLLKGLWSLGGGWARALAPPLLRGLRASKNPASQMHLKATIAQIGAAEALLPFTPEANRMCLIYLSIFHIHTT